MAVRWVLRGIVLAVSLSLVVAPAAAATTWRAAERVFDGSYRDPSMVVTRTGRVHLVARGETGLWHLTSDGGPWSRTRITRDRVIPSGDVGEIVVRAVRPALAFDRRRGTLVLAYLSAIDDGSTGGCTTSVLVRVRSTSGTWRRATPLSTTECPSAVSVAALDGHISVAVDERWYDWQNVDIVRRTAHGWRTTLLGRPADVPFVEGPADPDVAIDPLGRTLVAYRVRSTVRLAAVSGPDVARELVARVGPTLGQPALAMEGDGRAVVAWTSAAGTQVARRDPAGGDWTTTTVMPRGEAVAIAIEHGRIHLVVAAGAAGLWYARSTASGWVTEQLDARMTRILGGIGLDRAGGADLAWQRGRMRPRVWAMGTAD